MTDVSVLRLLILVENWLRNEPGSSALDRTPAGEFFAHPFWSFRHCLTLFFVYSFAQCFRYGMNDPMVVLGGLLWLCRTVDENRKKASILAVSVGRRHRVPSDVGIGSLPPALVDCSFVSSIIGGTHCG